MMRTQRLGPVERARIADRKMSSLQVRPSSSGRANRFAARACCALLASVASPSLLAAPAAAPYTAADIYNLVQVETPALSPAGDAVYYTASVASRAADESVSDIWRAPYAGGKAVNITNSPDRSEWSPKLSADGKTLFFLAEDSDDVAQVYVMPTKGGRARAATSLPAGVEDYDVSPDGARLAVTSETGGPHKNSAGTEPPIVVDAYVAKQDGRGYLGPARRQVFLVETKSGATTQLTRLNDDASAPAFSPDGATIAFVARGGAKPDRAMNYDIFLVEARAGAEPRQATRSPAADGDPDWGGPRWSPDGTRIVYARTDWPADGPYAQSTIGVLNVATGVETAVPSSDRWQSWPQWSADGSRILALVETTQAVRVAAIDPATGDAIFLTPDRTAATGVAVSRSAAVAVARGDKAHPDEIYALAGARLTDHNAWIGGRAQGEVRDINFRSGDGTEIRGLMMTPPGWTGAPAPTLFALHGGPVWQWQHEFDLAWQTFAAAGYVVIGVNPRGSSGRGQAFAKALWRDWGGVEVRDVKAGIDWALKEGIADSRRLGVYGWSWGGILADYMIASEPRLGAAISGAGMGNFQAAYGTDQYAIYYDVELGAPFENEALWRKVSYPFYSARKIKTPTLFQCAGEDDNVPCIGAEQMYAALKRAGAPTRLVVFPGENHGLSTPSYLEAEIEMNIAWFDRWLLAKPDSAQAAP